MRLDEILNIDEAKKLEETLKDWTEYIPFELLSFIDRQEYFNRWSKEAKIQFRQTRQNLPYDKKQREEYLINDLIGWIKKYPQFENLLKE